MRTMRREDVLESELQKHARATAILITLLGFLARLWLASGTFLNPDEALHFRLANQVSLALAYRASLTSAHPPLLIVLLYFWRALGTSSFWLRLPSVLAGVAFCWMFYKWLTKAAGDLAGVIGLLMVALLPTIALLTLEVRQYALLLAFLASALYFLDQAFAENSPGRMVAFSLFLYFAILSHYSAFLFAAALGIYALLRIRTPHVGLTVVLTWIAGQALALALAVFLWQTQLSKLGAKQSRTALQGWMSEFYLRKHFFDPGHDNPLLFLISHSFSVFQFIFGHRALGSGMGLFFVGGVALLLRGKGLPDGDGPSARRLGLFLFLPFAIAGGACLAHVYPYGSTRHIAFLIIPGAAGVSVAIASLAAGRWARGLAISAAVVVACVAFGKPPQPRMERADQSLTHMADAMQFVRQKMSPSDLIFTDYQTNLILGHYLCEQRFISLETAHDNFEQFSCAGHRIVSTDYKTVWMFSPETFLQQRQQFVQAYSLHPGETVWVFQVGWGVHLPEDLQSHVAEFHDLRFEPFGQNIKIFRMTVGQPMPAAGP